MNLLKQYFMSIKTSSAEIEPVTTSIETLSAQLSTASAASVAMKYQNNIYVFGGIKYVGSSQQIINSIYKYNIPNKTCTLLNTTLPVTESLSGIGLYDRYIYIIGGYNGSGRDNRIFKFDTNDDSITTISTTLPTNLSNFGYAQVGNVVYIFGGYSTTSQKKIYKFDMSTETVSTSSTELPSIRHNVEAVAVDNNIYVLGGKDSSLYTTAYLFNTTNESLTQVYASLPSVDAYRAVGFGNDIILFGGIVSGTYQNKIYKFDTTNLALSELSITMPERADNIAPAKDGYYAYYFGGEISSSSYTNKIVKFTKGSDITSPTIDSTLENNSWDTIKYAIDNDMVPSGWLGQTKEIDSGTYAGYNVRLVDLTANRYSKTSSGSTNAVFQFSNCLTTTYGMNSTATNVGGWASCSLRTTLNSTFLQALPQDLQDVISECTVLSGTGNSTTSGTSSSNNKIFLPCEWEMFGANTYGIGSSEGTPQYQYYAQGASYRILTIYGTSTKPWWRLRSPWSGLNAQFCVVDDSGGPNASTASDLNGVAPCFAI